MYWLDIKFSEKTLDFTTLLINLRCLPYYTTKIYYLSPPSHPSSQILRKYLF